MNLGKTFRKNDFIVFVDRTIYVKSYQKSKQCYFGKSINDVEIHHNDQRILVSWYYLEWNSSQSTFFLCPYDSPYEWVMPGKDVLLTIEAYHIGKAVCTVNYLDYVKLITEINMMY